MRKGVLLALMLLPATVLGDTVILRNGSSFQGTFVRGSRDTITFTDQVGRTRQFATRDVQSLVFGPFDSPSINPNAYRPASGGVAAGAEVLPIGTLLEVRTNETIDSKTYLEGQRYSAELSQPVYDSSGQIVFPQGAEAKLVIRQISSGGASGTPTLALDLDSITAGGSDYVVSTADLVEQGRQGLGKNKRTGQMVGGGAALGALIGAIAGHGAGAAIGAAAGAGAGAAAEIVTKGQQVKVPAETILRFRLEQPLTLQPAN